MANPKVGDDRKIKIVIRYLINVPRLITYMGHQDYIAEMDLYTDRDSADDVKTSNSSSG